MDNGEVEVKKKDDILNKPLPKHDGKESCSMITGFDEMMAEFQEIPPSLEKVADPDIQARILMEGAKFKQFFDQIGLKREARLEATKALIKVVET